MSQGERFYHRDKLAIAGVEQDQQRVGATLGMRPGLGPDHPLGNHRGADRVQRVAVAEHRVGLLHVNGAA